MSRTKSNECVVEHGVGTLGVKVSQRIPWANAHALRRPTCGQSPVDLPSVAVCPVVCLDLPQFNWPPLTEVWTSSLPVTYHKAEGIRCAMNDEVLFGALQSAERPGARLDSMTDRAYRRLLGQARDLGYPYLLRVWNYFPRINSESDRMERY